MAKFLKIYSYNKCATCRKAISWLIKNDIEHQLIDIITTPPSENEIRLAIKQLGEIKYLLNTSGKSYRNIGANNIKSMSEDKIIELMILDGKLIKRPFAISKKGYIFVGFNDQKWSSIVSD